MKYSILIFLLLGSWAGLQAQEKLSLKEALSIALDKNFDIKISKNLEQLAHNNVNLGNAGMLPRLEGTYNTGGSIQNTKQTPASGPERSISGARSTNQSYGANLNWTIFDGFGMFASYDKLKELEKQGELNSKSAILNTIADVIAAYYNIVKQQQLVLAGDSALDVSKFRIDLASTKLQLGRGSKLDVLAAQVDYNADTSNYLQQISLLKQAKVALNRILNKAIHETDYQVENNIQVNTDLNFTELARLAQLQNPRVQSAIINQRIAELNFKEARSSRYPQISLNSGYSRSQSSTPTGFNQQFQANGFSYGLTASINIFNGFLQRQKERNARLDIETAKMGLDQSKTDIQAQLQSAFIHYQTYLDLNKLEQRNLEIANQNLSITLDKYRLGSIAPLELREAQKNAITALNRSIEVQYQAKLAEVTLKEMAGNISLEP